MTELENNMINTIKKLEKGQLITYKEVAILSGYPNCARQVSRVLNKYSKVYKLPWHRIVGSGYKIRLKHFEGFELQKKLLESEGFTVLDSGLVTKSVI